MSIDKEKTCYDCPDRRVGCHASCEGYQKRRTQYDEQARRRFEQRQARFDADNFVFENARRSVRKQRRNR